MEYQYNWTSNNTLDFAANFTLSHCPGVDEATKIITRIQKGMTPVICAFGLIGNLVSMTVFLYPSQRKTSCSLYLAARSISDSGFLLALLIVCLTDLGINIFNNQGICQIVVFLTYICGFFSVWLVVMVTLENYIRICHPFSVHTHCKTSTAKIVLICLLTAALVLYNFPLWTSGLVLNTVTGRQECSSLQSYNTILQVITYVDTTVTLVLPTFIIVGLMVAITYSMLELFHRQSRLKGARLTNNDSRRLSPQSKVTRLLFAVSFVFVALTIPSHVIRLQMLVKYLHTEQTCNNMSELAVQKAFLMLYYLSFSVNIIIYLFFGETFRKVFLNIWCAKVYRSNSRCTYDNMELTINQNGRLTNCTSQQYTNVQVQVPDPDMIKNNFHQ